MSPRALLRLPLAASLLVLLLASAPRTHAQASIGSFSVTPSSFSFPNANPGTTPSIAGSANPISVSFSVSNVSSFCALYVSATTDLTSGGNTISVSNISWTATGTSFNSSGTVAKGSNTTVAFTTSSGSYSGQMSYFFANSASYAAGVYTVTLNYSLIDF